MILELGSLFLGVFISAAVTIAYHAGLYMGRKREPPGNPTENEMEKARQEIEAINHWRNYSVNDAYGDGV